ncbi:hypothetical protein KL930_003693 [Ogataea haglerorum]|uniref:Transcriptional adapter 2 n=1 Tax=Ogataea haglerorum TaxID=1937702 RepID=A0AAN6D719_9ASCO|nr:uncharacterized protein KL911_003285 [Ogataea haglerorum]KAG7695696.1 hypothetical protein KL915_003086 [Ogataea haglerorum]KAG7705551.1 hypothetical protein KL914_003389 [Ogataea haglerorum]KAG7707432.1 hypothetical protein KL950_003092 [Ogataea haglerorum]KAG7718272.1 hypothetical protein KL913_002267 [Ogataea haglerorum]KAG7718879.1 hypothetical protein KL949_002875 [Ogataea haglerorum]
MAKFHCDVCSSDCTRRVRIRCAVCADYDLCVPCFAKGESSGKHKPYHDYQVIEQHQYPIFDEDWGADEELLLIEGCQTLGLGNWQDISDFIGGRSKEEVGKHYEEYYLNSPCYPIPDLNKTFEHVSTSSFLRKRKQRLDSRKNMPLPPPKKVLTSKPLCSDIQKYMPGRLEFEEEADDEAEKVVQDMVFEGDETKEDIELKLTILDIYNSKLTMRAERKRLMLKNNLLDYRNNIAIDKKRTKEERELYNKLKAFARIMTPEDFKEFTDDMLSEVRIRNRIQQLQEWRRNGVMSFEGGAKYEKDKISRLSSLNLGIGAAPITSGRERHTLNSVRSTSRHQTPSFDGNSKKRGNQPLDISQALDYDLLSDEEKVLCSNLRILPKPYLAIKETFFRELLRTGGVLKRKIAKELIKIDPAKTMKIYDFFVQQKWCNAT